MVAYHVNEHRGTTELAHATGVEQWLGDGYYFWQDMEFAKEWVPRIKGNMRKKHIKNPKVDLYTVEIDIAFDEQADNIIDTAFNEEDYYNFAEAIDTFATHYVKIFGEKPDLAEFNSFLIDNNINYWNKIAAMRFQDSPINNDKAYLLVSGYPYKKRIQIVLRDLDKVRITKLETL